MPVTGGHEVDDGLLEQWGRKHVDLAADDQHGIGAGLTHLGL